jgi:hypothetical protein
MTKHDDFRAESLVFAEKVRNVTSYGQERWFNSSYSTIKRTVKGGLSQEVRKKIRDLLFYSIDHLKTFSTSEYDKWFFELTEEITEISKLSFGQAQKLTNILMKYHFSYFYSDFNLDWKKKYQWMVQYFDSFHVPIDRIVIGSLAQKYSFKISQDKISWSKWQWKDKTLYEEIQNLTKKIAEKSEKYYSNRLYFEMKELWKSPSARVEYKDDYTDEKNLKWIPVKNELRNFLEEIISQINKQGFGEFELNETSGYFSIQRAGMKRYKNVVCFVKNEQVLSLSKYANIEESWLCKPSFSKLRKKSCPPKALQLRKENWYLYPVNLEYNISSDKDAILELCMNACRNFSNG